MFGRLRHVGIAREEREKSIEPVRGALLPLNLPGAPYNH